MPDTVILSAAKDPSGQRTFSFVEFFAALRMVIVDLAQEAGCDTKVDMNIVETLDEFGEQILDPQFTPAELRNRLGSIRDQVAAREAAYVQIKNEYTHFKNTTEQKITELKEAKQKLITTLAELETKNGESEIPIGHRPPPPLGEVDPVAVKILKFFFDNEDNGATALGALDTDDAARFLNVKMNIAQHHLDELRKIALLDYRSDLEGYCLVPRGRAFIMKHNLA